MNIGWIGTGIMGFSMCKHLMDAGNKAIVFNRTQSKAQGLVELGAELAKTPAQVASSCDVLFTMLTASDGFVVVRSTNILAAWASAPFSLASSNPSNIPSFPK